MKTASALILLFFASPGRGEDARPAALAAPAGRREERGGALTVSLGFGSVTLPAEGLGRAAGPAPEAPGRLKACNEGTFSLRYELVLNGGRAAVRKASVRVRNSARFFDAPTPRLRAHEAMHQRINDAAAARLERELSAWSAEAADLKTGEALLRADFRGRLEAVKALHREWDANSVFVEPASAKP